MNQYDIYGIGAALVDTEIEVTEMDLQDLSVDKGVMTLVDEQRQTQLIDSLKGHLVASKRASGGSAANSVIAASCFGSSTFYSCKVASDENGSFYLKDLADCQVSFPADSGDNDGITGKCLVMITPDAERTMNTFLGISEHLSIDEIDEEALKNSKYVYIEGYLVTSETGRPAAIKLRELAEKHGVKTALSLSDPAMVNFFKEGITEMIGGGVDLLFCNEAEATSYTQRDSVVDAADALRKIAKAFVITLGKDGALIFDGENFLSVESHPVAAIDTNGAGDMFAGAFLYALTQGKGYKFAGQLASRASAQVVSQFGPRLKPEDHKALLEEVNS